MNNPYCKLEDISLRQHLYHLICAGSELWEDIEIELCNLLLIEEMCRRKMSSYLLEGYREVLKDIFNKPTGVSLERVKEFSDFIQGQLHILQFDSKLTFQQAANQPATTAPSKLAMEQWKKETERQLWLRLIHQELSGISGQISFSLNNPPFAIAISCSGERITYYDGQIRVYDVQFRDKILSLNIDSITSLALSPDGKRLAYTENLKEQSSICSLFDIDEQEKMAESEEYSRQVHSLRFSPSGKLIGLGGFSKDGGGVAIWNVSDNTRSWCKSIQNAIVRKVEFLPDSLCLVAAQGDGVCSFWNADNGTLEKEIRVHQDAVTDLSISRSGEYIATSSKDGFCRVWPSNLKNGSSVRFRQALEVIFRRKGTFFSAHPTSPTSIAFLNDSQIVSGDGEGCCYIWDRADGKLRGSPLSMEGAVSCLETSQDKSFLCALSNGERTCHVFETQQFQNSSLAPLGNAWFIRFLQESNELLIVGQGGQIQVLPLEEENLDQSHKQVIDQFPEVIAGEVSSNGRFIVVVNRESRWKLWDRKTSKEISGKFKTPVYMGALVSVSPNGELICLVSREIIEFVAPHRRKPIIHKLPMIPEAIGFKDDTILRIVGVNLRMNSLPPESVMVVDIDVHKKSWGYQWGPFKTEVSRKESSFVLSRVNSFMTCSKFTDGHSIVNLWDMELWKNEDRPYGSKEFSGPVDIHYLTNDGKWALISEPSRSMCYIIDATTPDLEAIWLYPLPEALVDASMQEDGDLIALIYGQGGANILQRVGRK